MHKILSLVFIFTVMLFGQTVFAATTASQTVNATLTRAIPPGPGPGPGPSPTPIPAGAIVGIASGGTAAGASALAFAPLLLAGLEPNSVVCAAAPLECLQCIGSYLQYAIVDYFGSAQNIIEAMKKMQAGEKKYLALNNSEILNGTFDIQSLTLPKGLENAQRIKVNIIMASQSYKEVQNQPELSFGIYKDIVIKDLSKKFETQQFLHHYLMKRYEIPLKITSNQYNKGIQRLSGVIDMRQVQKKQAPMQVAVRYTEGGFRKNLKRQNPKTLAYAYLIEFEKIR